MVKQMTYAAAMFIGAGTVLSVPPAADLPQLAGRLSSHIVEVDPAEIASGASNKHWDFRAGDLHFLMRTTHIVSGDGATTWHGKIDGDPLSGFVLTLDDQQVAGGFWTSLGAFELAPTGEVSDRGNPVCIASLVERDAVVACAQWTAGCEPPADSTRSLPHPGVQVSENAAHSCAVHRPLSPTALQAEGLRGSAACACPDDQTTIDILFVYTSLARDAAGGVSALRARATNAVQAANAAFQNSGISRLSLNRVNFREIAYDESSPQWINHLERITNINDGFMEDAHAWRDTDHADLVCLIVDDARFTGGAAWWAPFNQALGFSCCNWRSLGGGSLLLAHEIGHNFGCAHDRLNDSSALTSYSWGYFFSSGGTTYGTIMSYPGDVHIPFFSNPDLVHSTGQAIGRPLSDAQPAFNALMIDQTRRTLANFRASATRTPDCNGNGVDDALDISIGVSVDSNGDCRPDECDARIYVDAANPSEGKGDTWAHARTDLAETLAIAALPCGYARDIWVADGEYAPDSGSGSSGVSFNVRGPLALYGGFRGLSRPGGPESSLEQRIPGLHPSVLTGNIGDPGLSTDNSWTIVRVDGPAPDAIIDGFTIEHAAGGGAGGGLSVNNADLHLSNSVIRMNQSGSGGGVFAGANSHLTVTSCDFDTNAATFAGGALAAADGGMITVGQCRLHHNTATWGAAVSLARNGSAGGFDDCLFEENSASSNGGAFDCYDHTHLSITDSVLRVNEAAGGGGGGLNMGLMSTLSMQRCDVIDHTALWGGGLAIERSTAEVESSRFLTNHASTYNGGGIDAFQTHVSLANCILSGNTCAWNGGAVWLDQSIDSRIVNCTIHANASALTGGGMTLFSGAASILNSILSGNIGTQGATRDRNLLFGFGAVPTVRYSLIRGLGVLPGPGNLNAEPQFNDPASGDYSLLPGSPCIDHADTAAIPEGIETDIAGNPRRIDDPAAADTGAGLAPFADLGALERLPPPACPCDWNQQDGLDSQDFFDFLDGFFNGNADFNGVDGTDSQDFFEFLDCFFSGCV